MTQYSRCVIKLSAYEKACLLETWNYLIIILLLLRYLIALMHF